MTEPTLTKEFHIGDILSITTGRLVSPRRMEGVYDILNWMTGESLYTHQLPRISREAAPVLLRVHPQLRAVDADADITPATIDAWLSAQKAIYGELLPVPKMNEDEHERIDTLSELSEMVHPDKIMVVRP